eukprot:1953059-Amphidinium_carterae.2
MRRVRSAAAEQHGMPSNQNSPHVVPENKGTDGWKPSVFFITKYGKRPEASFHQVLRHFGKVSLLNTSFHCSMVLAYSGPKSRHSPRSIPHPSQSPLTSKYTGKFEPENLAFRMAGALETMGFGPQKDTTPKPLSQASLAITMVIPSRNH